MNDSLIKEVTLAGIRKAIAGHGIEKARQFLSAKVGSAIKVEGAILKVIKRNENLKLLCQTDTFKVFAEFKEGFEGKFRKGGSVKLIGRFQTFGYESICLIDAKIREVRK